MTQLALGTAQFGLDYGVASNSGKITLEEAHKIFSILRTRGTVVVDTAIGYGSSEEVLGEVGVGDFRVITKIPEVPQDYVSDPEWIFQAVRDSLKRLRIRSVYGLLLHRPLQLLERQGKHIHKALTYLKNEGLVENIGISVYSPLELDQVIPVFDFDIVQAPVNLLDQRLIKSGWLNRLKSLSIEVHARSVFLQGLLLMPASRRPKYFSQWETLFGKYDLWLKKNNLNPVDACLRFIFTVPGIDQVVVGVDSVEQLQQVIETIKKPGIDVPDYLVSDQEPLVNPAMWTI